VRKQIAQAAILFLSAIFCSCLFAANYEIHPGVYASYEYTDNYFGTAHDEEGESIYEIGPSLEILFSTPSVSWDNSGHLAKSYHKKFDEDDSTEGMFGSHLTAAHRSHSLDLDYSFTQTSRRESLEDPLGTSRVHSGTAGYTNTLSPATSLALGYTLTDERNPSPDEDLMSQGPSFGLTHQITPRQSLSLTYGYVYHNYEISDNTWISTSSAHWGYMVTSSLELGTGFTYEHEDRGRMPSEDIYTALVTAGYSVTPHTDISIGGGYSWLVMEHEDRQSTYTLDAELSTETRYDVFSLSASKGYTAEYTTDRYGTYDTISAILSWDRTLARTLRSSVAATYEDRKPASDIQEQEEKDFVGRFSLIWDPVRYVSATASYEHLQHNYEISDTERENRYRIIIEGRY
jgi:hypothetical protein